MLLSAEDIREKGAFRQGRPPRRETETRAGARAGGQEPPTPRPFLHERSSRQGDAAEAFKNEDPLGFCWEERGLDDTGEGPDGVQLRSHRGGRGRLDELTDEVGVAVAGEEGRQDHHMRERGGG